MQNIFLFFWKNHFSILFIVLEVIGFFMLASNDGFHQSKLHQTGVALSGNVYSLQHAYTQYLGLTEENFDLRKENAELLEQLINPPPLGRRSMGQFAVTPVEAINSTYHLQNNFIIISAGDNVGIRAASAVVGPSGIVGIVHSVSSNYSSVLPLLHSNTNINARLAKSSYFGQCKWDGQSEEIMILENIPNHVEIQTGDSIITRGGGGIFPSGLLIGYAQASEKDESTGFQEIEVRLATNFKKINTLFVIQNELQTEFDSLMTETQEWIDN